MIFLLIAAVFAGKSSWRLECDLRATSSWNSIDDKAGFGKAFFKNWLSAEPAVDQIFKNSNFPQGPAQFLVERFDAIFNVLNDEDALANQLQAVAKTHVKEGVSQSDIYSFQKSFLDTLPSFTEKWSASDADAWAYVLSHVIVSPLIEMGSATSTYMGVRTVKSMWAKVDQKKVCDKLFDQVMKDDAIMGFFKGVSKTRQSALFCAFVSTIMGQLTLPGDDSYAATNNFKQLAGFHAGMGVGAGLFLSFEYYLMKSFEGAMTMTKDQKNSLVNTLHVHVFDRLVRYSQKWKYADWKKSVRELDTCEK